MDIPADARRFLLPGFLYSSSSSARALGLDRIAVLSRTPTAAPAPPPGSFNIESPSEPGKIEMHSPLFYAACTAGGIASCGLTHMAVTPLDLVKCNMQVSSFVKNLRQGQPPNA